MRKLVLRKQVLSDPDLTCFFITLTFNFRRILEQNGSAVDATLATMFCNGVLNMHSMGLGGGFLMTIYARETKEVTTLNAREAAPLAVTEAMFQNNSDLTKQGNKHA